MNVYAAAIRFLYCVTLKRPEVVTGLVHVKTPMRLRRVLSGVDVARLSAALPTERYRVMGMLAYGAGLRVGEIVRLEIGDIDAKRMVLHIRDARPPCSASQLCDAHARAGHGSAHAAGLAGPRIDPQHHDVPAHQHDPCAVSSEPAR